MKIKVHGYDNYKNYLPLFSTLSKVFFCEFSDKFEDKDVIGHIIFTDNEIIDVPQQSALIFSNNYVKEKSLMAIIRLNSLCFSEVKINDESFLTKSLELKKTVNIDPRYRIIASQGDQAIWYIDEQKLFKHYYSLIPPCNPENHQSLKDNFNSEDFIRILPIITFLRELSKSDSLIYPSPKASIIIDDPNLHRSKYGYIDYEQLITDAKTNGYHINLATIPLDLYYASKKVVKLFKNNSKYLSLIIHGNNHTSNELMVNSPNKAYSKLLKIKKRVDKFYQRYGIRVGNIIIPPHGMMSREFLKIMSLFEFSGACVSRPFPWSSGKTVGTNIEENQNYSKLLPADFIEGTPIVPRMKDFNDIPFKLLLHIPLVFYFHHEDFKHGINNLGEIVERINKYADVSWCSLINIFQANYVIKKNTDKEAIVFLFSKNVIVDIPVGIEKVYFKIINNIGRSREMELWINEEKYAMEYYNDNIYSSPEIIIDKRNNFNVQFNCVAEKEMLNLQPELNRLYPFIRRIITESRDMIAPIFS